MSPSSLFIKETDLFHGKLRQMTDQNALNLRLGKMDEQDSKLKPEQSTCHARLCYFRCSIHYTGSLWESWFAKQGQQPTCHLLTSVMSWPILSYLTYTCHGKMRIPSRGKMCKQLHTLASHQSILTALISQLGSLGTIKRLPAMSSPSTRPSFEY